MVWVQCGEKLNMWVEKYKNTWRMAASFIGEPTGNRNKMSKLLILKSSLKNFVGE